MTTASPLLAFGLSLATALMLVVTQRWHGRFTHDHTEGIQKFHVHPTPRIGGLAIIVGLYAGALVLADDSAVLLWPALLAGLVAFGFGLLEDITRQVGALDRLLATMASGVLAWWLTGISLDRLDVWLLDDALTWPPFSVLFTAVAVGGVANAVNLIDGFNGLASGSVVIALLSLATMAALSGDPALASACLLIAAATLGFGVLNFPFGKIFLGDGGAYLLGFLLAWMAILLVTRNPSISPWAPLLACGYPIIETLFSMTRRLINRSHPGKPDCLHLHSLIKTRIIHPRLGHWPIHWRNAIVAPFGWLIAVLTGGLAILFMLDTVALIATWILCSLLYALWHRHLAHSNTQVPNTQNHCAD